jgi:hypothetical protein
VGSAPHRNAPVARPAPAPPLPRGHRSPRLRLRRGGEDARFAWTLWSLEWGAPPLREHTVASRAIDTAGQVRPAPDGPLMADKLICWESNGQVTHRVRIP